MTCQRPDLHRFGIPTIEVQQPDEVQNDRQRKADADDSTREAEGVDRMLKTLADAIQALALGIS